MKMQQPEGSVRSRSRFAIGMGVVLVLGGVAAFLVVSQRAVLPVPTPANLGSLDPQVRWHVANVVKRVVEAPRSGALRAELGLAFAANGLWAEARQSFLDALALGGDDPLPALYAAVALQELGEDAQATLELREVVRRFPEFAPAWYRLGMALLASGDAAGGVEAFATVTRLVPEGWHGWAGLGDALIRSGRVADAVAALERARGLQPAARPVRQLLGQAYRAAGRTDDAELEARAGGTRTLTPMPDAWSVKALEHMKLLADQFEHADALVAQGQAMEAVSRLQEALRFHPTNAVVVSTLARALVAGGRANAAWSLLQPHLDREPQSLVLLLAGVDAAAAMERPEEALSLAARAKALAPRAVESHVAEANALLAAGRDAEAADVLGEAARLAPSDAGLLAQLGDVVWHNLQQPSRALEVYRRARAIDPLNLGVLERMAALELELGEAAAARTTLEALRSAGASREILEEAEARLAEGAGAP